MSEPWIELSVCHLKLSVAVSTEHHEHYVERYLPGAWSEARRSSEEPTPSSWHWAGTLRPRAAKPYSLHPPQSWCYHSATNHVDGPARRTVTQPESNLFIRLCRLLTRVIWRYSTLRAGAMGRERTLISHVGTTSHLIEQLFAGAGAPNSSELDGKQHAAARQPTHL